MSILTQHHNLTKGEKRRLPYPNNFKESKVLWEWDEDGDLLHAFLLGLKAGNNICIDLETTGLDPYTSEITIMGISKNGFDVLLVRGAVLTASGPLQDLFNHSMQSADFRKIMHNAKFDMKFMARHYGSEFANVDCTYVMRRELVCGLEHSASLAACSYEYLGYEMSKEIRDTFIGNTVITEPMKEYAAIDVSTTWHLFPILNAYIDIEQLRDLHDNIERDCTWVVAKMELEGIDIDAPFLKVLEVDMVHKTDNEQAELDATLRILNAVPKVERKLKKYEATPDQERRGVTHVLEYKQLNVNSSKQVVDMLNKIGFDMKSSSGAALETPIYTATSLNIARETFRRDLTDAGILEVSLDIALRIAALRKSYKAINSFIIPLQDKFTNPVTGRVHASFNQ